MNKAPQPHWDKLNTSFDFEIPAANDYTRLIIEKYIPKVNKGDAIEIGCYPGRYLAIFGGLGYTLHGIDMTTRTLETELNLKQSGFKTGDIQRLDFFKFEPGRLYEVVTSFGFIEHFENYLAVIDLHTKLVKQEGYLVLGAPNFRYGLQYLFHYLFDTNGLHRHVLKSMDPDGWKEHLNKHGFDVLWSGYCGGLRWWMDKDQSQMQNVFGMFL